MKKTTQKKLTLNRETVKNLESGKLIEIAGGGLTHFTDCYTICPECPPYW